MLRRILPAGVLNVIVDNNELGAGLTSHPDVAKISFTGSTATGRKIFAAGADDLKRITLELGGNDARVAASVGRCFSIPRPRAIIFWFSATFAIRFPLLTDISSHRRMPLFSVRVVGKMGLEECYLVI